MYVYFVSQKVIHRRTNVQYAVLQSDVTTERLNSLFELMNKLLKNSNKRNIIRLMGIGSGVAAYKVPSTPITDTENTEIHCI